MEMISESFVGERLAELRLKKNVSAREMSLALGQNPSYINRIENGVSYPSMQCFFYICEYLQISPAGFFDTTNREPGKRRAIEEAIAGLGDRQLDVVLTVARALGES